MNRPPGVEFLEVEGHLINGAAERVEMFGGFFLRNRPIGAMFIQYRLNAFVINFDYHL